MSLLRGENVNMRKYIIGTLMVVCVLFSSCKKESYQREVDETEYSYVEGITDFELSHTSRGTSTEPATVTTIKLDAMRYFTYEVYYDHEDQDKDVIEYKRTQISDEVMNQFIDDLLNENDIMVMKLDQDIDYSHEDGASNYLHIQHNETDVSFGGYGIYLNDEYSEVIEPFNHLIDEYLFGDSYVEMLNENNLTADQGEIIQLAKEVVSLKLDTIDVAYSHLINNQACMDEIFKSLADYDSTYEFLEAENNLIYPEIYAFLNRIPTILEFYIVTEDRVIDIFESATDSDYALSSYGLEDVDSLALLNRPVMHIEDSSFVYINYLSAWGVPERGYIFLRIDASHLYNSLSEMSYEYKMYDEIGYTFYDEEQYDKHVYDGRLYIKKESDQDISLGTWLNNGWYLEAIKK